MTDHYLDIFPNLFCDVKKCDEVKSIITQIDDVFSSIITRYGELENEIAFDVSGQDDFTDIVICLFIRKIMEQLDAINVLYSVGSSTPAQILLRSLIENIISLKFILKEDTKKRAATYFLEHHYQEIELGQSCFNPHSNLGKITKRQNEQYFNDSYEQFQKKKAAVQKLIMKNSMFQEIDRNRREKIQHKKKTGSKRSVHIQWYEVCSNASSFYDLMKETGYEKYYQGLYGGLSYETHSLNSTMGINVTENGFFLKKIRSMEEGSSTFSISCTFSVALLQDLYNYLEDGEDEKREFRNFFLSYQDKRKKIEKHLDAIKSSTIM